jgi:hypothetical protein
MDNWSLWPGLEERSIKAVAFRRSLDASDGESQVPPESMRRGRTVSPAEVEVSRRRLADQLLVEYEELERAARPLDPEYRITDPGVEVFRRNDFLAFFASLPRLKRSGIWFFFLGDLVGVRE